MGTSDPTAKLCETCSGLYTQYLAYPIHPCCNRLPCSEPSIDRGHVTQCPGYLSLGSTGAVKNRRSTCDICKLVAECLDKEPSDLVGECRITETEKYCSFTLPSDVDAGDPTVTHFHLTQTSVIFDPPPATRVLGPVLPWDYKERDESKSRYILHLQTKARSRFELGDLASAPPQREQEFLSTIGGRYVGTQVDTELVRAWLRQCEREHGEDCTSSMQLLGERHKEPTFVVDAVQSCLVDTPSKCRYVALSYVWGGAAVFRHLLANTADLRKPGSLHSLPIPATIRDAITLVRAIGERYLWADSLCIIQDDLRMQQTEITRMGSIYSGALFTIIAAAGDHANVGLPGVEQGSRRQVQKTLRFPNYELLSVIDIRLTPSGISDTIWATRAWTFQERTLSNRVLVFSENQVYWKCRVASHSEERALERVWDVNWFHKPFPQGYRADTLSWRSLEPLEYCRPYEDLLYLYRQRHMTYETDILNAFSGVTELLGAIQGDTFFWGLSEWLFSYALTWELIGRSSRNYIDVPVFGSDSSEEMVPIPSWSWGAWSGGKDSHLWNLIDGEYVHPLIQFGIVDNNRQLVMIKERSYPGPNYPTDHLRAALQPEGGGDQSRPLPSLPPGSRLQIGLLCFWSSYGSMKVIRRWSQGLRGLTYNFSPTLDPEFFTNTGNDADGRSEIVQQDFVVIAGRGTGRLILLAVEWKDGVAYRAGKAEIGAASWARVKNRQWRLITLG